MQQSCNKFVMDMTDTRMGPEQKCRNCQFMKKEHNQSNSQQITSNAANTNKVSDLMKKFSGPSPQIQEKFQGAVRSSVQQSRQEDNIPSQMKESQTKNQSNQSNIPIRKIESQTISNESPSQPNNTQENLEKQKSNEVKEIQQPPKQQVQIETTPIQTKLANNPFLKNDKQKSNQNQGAFVKPIGQNKVSEDQSKQQQILQNKQQAEQQNNVASQDQNQKSNFQEIKNAFTNQSPLIQQDSTQLIQQSQQQKIQIPINLPIFGFGPPPVKKISNQQEPESYFEQQMIERPTIQQKKKKRTIKEFSELD